MADYKCIIENWHIEGDLFTPPELAVLKVVGKPINHPDPKFDGSRNIVATVLNANGRIIKTKNSTYKLGTPNKEYINWMKENSISFDPENPITIKREN
jgi:hypothetical protein